MIRNICSVKKNTYARVVNYFVLNAVFLVFIAGLLLCGCSSQKTDGTGPQGPIAPSPAAGIEARIKIIQNSTSISQQAKDQTIATLRAQEAQINSQAKPDPQ